MRRHHVFQRLLSLLLTLAVVFSLAPAALAAEESAKGSTVQLSKTEGTVTVTNGSGKTAAILKNMKLFNGYHVKTAEKSYAWLNLDSAKLIKTDAVSEVELRESGKELEVLLDSGNLFFNVSEDLKDDETLNIRTSTMVAGIRGTCGWVQVIDRWNTLVYILEGRVECHVTDPVTGQIDSTILTGGEWANFVVYPQDREGDKCDIIRRSFTEPEIPGFVLVELVKDEPLCGDIYEDSGLDILGRYDNGDADRRQDDEEAETAQRLEEIREQEKQQEHNISKDPVWKDQAQDEDGDDDRGSSGGSSSGGSTGGNTTPTRPTQPDPTPTSITLILPKTAQEVADAVALYDNVTVLPGPGSTPAEHTLTLNRDLTVPAGKTLTVQDENTTTSVEAGRTLQVDGTMDIAGNFSNAGTLNVTSGNTFKVGGSFSNESSGEINNTGNGRIVAEEGIVSAGKINNSGSAEITSGALCTIRLAASTDNSTRVAGITGGWITNTNPKGGAALAWEMPQIMGLMPVCDYTRLRAVTPCMLLEINTYRDLMGIRTMVNYAPALRGGYYSLTPSEGREAATVYMNPNGGTVVDSLTPVLYGSVFQGWNSSADGSGTDYADFLALSAITGATTTVYAQWGEAAKHAVTISGTVKDRDSGIALPGHTTVDLVTTDGTETVIATATVNPDGSYTITAEVPEGTYGVRPSTDYPTDFGSSGYPVITVTKDETFSQDLSVALKSCTLTITGRARDNNYVDLPGVTVTLTDGSGTVLATAVTNDSGNYSITASDIKCGVSYTLGASVDVADYYTGTATQTATGSRTIRVTPDEILAAGSNPVPCQNQNFEFVSSFTGGAVWGYVYGKVTDEGNAPVEGATVKIYGDSDRLLLTCTTDSEGNYSTLNPGSGKPTLLSTHALLMFSITGFHADKGSSTNSTPMGAVVATSVDLTLEKTVISGKVTDARSNAVGGVRVSLPASLGGGSATTDNDGNYALPPVAVEIGTTVTLSWSEGGAYLYGGNGVSPRTTPVTITRSGAVTANITQSGVYRRLTGIILDRYGNPVTSNVRLAESPNSGGLELFPDEQGRFTTGLIHLSNTGSIEVFAIDGDGYFGSVTYSIPRNADASPDNLGEIRLTNEGILVTPVEISGRVADQNGNSIAGAKVATDSTEPVTTDGSGQFSLSYPATEAAQNVTLTATVEARDLTGTSNSTRTFTADTVCVIRGSTLLKNQDIKVTIPDGTYVRTVTGKVTNESGGAVSGAQVSSGDDYLCTTNGSGVYKTDPLLVGKGVYLHAAHSTAGVGGGSKTYGTILNHDDGVDTVDIQLGTEVTVKGRITDAEGNYVSGSDIKFQEICDTPDGADIVQIDLAGFAVNEDGSYSATMRLTSGGSRLTVIPVAPDGYTATGSQTLAGHTHGQVYDNVDFTLTPAQGVLLNVNITGKVTTGGGAAVTGGKVSVTASDGKPYSAELDEAGEYKLENIPVVPGDTLTLTAQADNFAVKEEPLTIPADTVEGDSLAMNFQLRDVDMADTAAIFGRVQNDRGQNIVSARVTLYEGNSAVVVDYVNTGTDGGYVFNTSLTNGQEYRLEATANGFTRKINPFTYDGARRECDFVDLPSQITANLTGQVTSKTGDTADPVIGASVAVTITDENGNSHSLDSPTTGDDGKYSSGNTTLWSTDTVHFEVRKEGLAAVERDIRIVDCVLPITGGTVETDFELEPIAARRNVTISGTVKDEQNSGVSGAKVELLALDTESASAARFADGPGDSGDWGGSGEGTTDADPTDPVPTDPDPIDPVDPVDPVEPVEPADPGAPLASVTAASDGSYGLSLELPDGMYILQATAGGRTVASETIVVSESKTSFENINVTVGVDYTLENGKLTVLGCGAATAEKLSAALTEAGADKTAIQELVFHEGVTSIGNSAFLSCTALTSAEIPASVTSLGTSAFAQCTALESVTFAKDSRLETLGYSAFSNCTSLAAVEIPEGTKKIQFGAFRYCSALENVVIPDSVNYLGDSAFSNSGIKSVTLPAGITTIPQSMFDTCSNLTSIDIPASVTSIGQYAFHLSNLSSVNFPNGCQLQTIAQSAFAYCGALYNFNSAGADSNFVIPASVRSIGTKAFYGSAAGNLSFAAGSQLTEIPESAFASRGSDRRLFTAAIPDSVTTIGKYAFLNQGSLREVTFAADSQLETIGESAFQSCYLAGGLVIPKSVKSIGANAFSNCVDGVITQQADSQLESIADSAFWGCQTMTAFDIPATVTAIGNSAFNSCYKLARITIPEGVQTIGDSAFGYCKALESITIPSTVTSIGERAFTSCNALTSVDIKSGAIGADAFSSIHTLTSVTLREGVTSIGDSAFSSCDISSLAIPGSVTSIGDSAFSSCRKLTGVTFSTGLKTIGASAFWGCLFTQAVLPEGLETIGTSAFHSNTSLRSVYIPASVTSLGSSAFKNCTAITRIDFGGDEAAWNALGGASLELPSSSTINYNVTRSSAAMESSIESTAAVMAGFADVPADSWCADAADFCRDAGLMGGTGPNTFNPGGVMTRAQLAAVLHRLAGSPEPKGTGAPFADVPEDSWCAKAVLWAKGSGVMGGYAGGGFVPGGTVTREQLAAVLWRFAGSPQAEGQEKIFADSRDIASYAAQAAAWAGSAGVINGAADGRFNPKGQATRAHTAKILMNYARVQGVVTVVSAMDIMCEPSGAALMPDRSLLVTDTYNKLIWRVAGGVSSVYAGSETVEDLYGEPLGGYNDAALPESYFKRPWAIVPFLGGWAVSDTANNAVRLVTSEITQTVNGQTREKLEVSDLGVVFNHPTGLASDEAGSLYVADTLKDAIRKITPEGEVTTYAKNLDNPTGLCWANGALYAAESGAGRIVKITEKGNVSTVAGSGEAGFADGPADKARFSSPQGVAVGEDGTVYVADTANGAIRKIQNGQVTTMARRDVTDLDAFAPVSPTGLLVRGSILYICDNYARKLLVLPLN